MLTNRGLVNSQKIATTTARMMNRKNPTRKRFGLWRMKRRHFRPRFGWDCMGGIFQNGNVPGKRVFSVNDYSASNF
jgi:hypothetical protein